MSQAGRWRSVAVRFATPRPDQGVALTVFIVEEVGVDRSGEARIVELDREIIATLVGALGPGGADFSPADEDPVARGVVVGAVGFRNDADAFGLDAERHDLALELVAGLFEGADVRHDNSPVICCLRVRAHRGLDGDRRAEGDRRRTRQRAEAERRTAEGRLSCFARNDAAGVRGRKSSVAVASKAIEAQLSFGQITP
jgi:hypothetical protein